MAVRGALCRCFLRLRGDACQEKCRRLSRGVLCDWEWSGPPAPMFSTQPAHTHSPDNNHTTPRARTKTNQRTQGAAPDQLLIPNTWHSSSRNHSPLVRARFRAFAPSRGKVPRSAHRPFRGRVRVADGLAPGEGRPHGGASLRREGERDLRRLGEALRALRPGAGGDGQEVTGPEGREREREK